MNSIHGVTKTTGQESRALSAKPFQVSGLGALRYAPSPPGAHPPRASRPVHISGSHLRNTHAVLIFAWCGDSWHCRINRKDND